MSKKEKRISDNQKRGRILARGNTMISKEI